MLNLSRRKVAAPARPLPTLTPGEVIAMPVELLTVPQAAQFASVSHPTIRRWIRDEGLRSFQPKEKGRIRIDKIDLIKFLKGEAI
ncbi:helix-turn-helix domain-containing protein [Sphingopyxis sp. GW247-27LB]|uniref:helix-turn-helix domain-containing protein n=1 Tax=Sphingopyxis sp. GW247-27LB TaxID=2012632 RepID=UPI000BA7794C|nr:helix-turn-helix domain-containing protein [Sphingopyxis sp. GW247-27LB]PAL22802.1 hypothetical protein CD928_12205 [Sphingopyxis sp. GW247-27LB]